MRRLWYRDSYGRWHEERHAGGRAGMPAKWAMYALMMLAGIVVLASMNWLSFSGTRLCGWQETTSQPPPRRGGYLLSLSSGPQDW
jgi:hypothetical protein